MSQRQITLSRLEAKEKIQSQIEKGKELANKGYAIIKDKRNHEIDTRDRDNFEVTYEQWKTFTAEILKEIFVSSSYARDFADRESSQREYVGSDWIPDIAYYLQHRIFPQLDYLGILIASLDEFDEIDATGTKQTIKGKQQANEPGLEMPEKVTLRWLFCHVPLKKWLTFAGSALFMFAVFFCVGLVASNYDITKRLLPQLFWKEKDYGTKTVDSIPGSKSNVDAQIELLIGNHEKRMAQLHADYREQEREATSGAYLDSRLAVHKASAERISELIAQEQADFQKNIKSLREGE